MEKIDLSTMSPEELEALSQEIGAKIRGILDKACEEANLITKTYGLKAKMMFSLEPDSAEKTEQ